MFFSQWRLLTTGCLFVLLLNSAQAYASDLVPTSKEQQPNQVKVLKLVPSKCVALRKGRKCFATIKVEWQAPQVGDYCLRRRSDQMEINCWKNTHLGQFKYVFASSIDENLELVRASDRQPIAVSLIKVSWVHNSKKRRKRWRVF